MNVARPGPRLRSLLVWLLATALAVLLLRVAHRQLVRPLSGPAAFDELLARGCLIAIGCCTAWAWASVSAVVLEVLRTPVGGHLACAGPVGVPPLARRLVLLACGIALTGAAATPAGATPGPMFLGPGRNEGPVTAGLPYPDRPVDGEAPSGPTGRGSPADASALGAADSVVVRRGDSLWALTRTRLPGSAPDSQVASSVHLLHDANRAVIGEDPDLIVPGQRLSLPRELHHRPEGRDG
ncbi:LysM peptidoglycan-binding domain-containing protein [Nocardioides insulae]|uniref:LysM peptidoglycan-binding domain-containing protein n=1 Tax=Nocardioides insulae TaxID=394734 RepID=UPI00040D000A|nr:hypothetical protein [Nocardioides insulae]